ncbi:MAG: Sporulation initiation inhibitor protein Soj [Spirochaetes bacterium ADurb.BinA120]|nr:MAG: Sporulation initiation inhibitor protein Soj [Spirochaetes bacterium ADurb.BinA120]HOD40212.1 cyclic nucleotide-binding domain-containing protein [Candidatus Wallbacteria bacterium]HPG56442.1 cyclic nucleotide-binding domain-containing protein [Candidatus Wallbacteria bacterium]
MDLKQIPIFSSLNDSHVEKIKEIVEEISMPKGASIFKQGDFGDAFYIVISGKVKISKIEDGEDKTLAVLKEGEFFGEMALLEEAPRSASASCADDCKLYKITQKNFGYIMLLNPAISLKIMRFMSDRVRKSSVAATVAEKEGKIISFFAPKGGAGCSTFSANFAYGLSMNKDLRVLLVDLDLEFGSLDMILDSKYDKTIADIVKEVEIKNYENISQFLAPTGDNLKLMLAPKKPEEAELVKVKVVKEILEVLKGYFDYIIIDTPSSFTDHTLMSLDVAYRIVVVINSDILCLRNTRKCFEVMKSLEYPENKIITVLNRDDNLSSMPPEEIEKFIKTKVSHTIPNEYITMRKSTDMGVPFLKNAPASPVTSKFLEMINKIANQSLQVPKAETNFFDSLKNLVMGK